MLIFDDSNGLSDGKERDQLQAMVAVGSEFITFDDNESRVQKSGEFVRIEKDSETGVIARFVLFHETAQAFEEIQAVDRIELSALTSDRLLSPGGTKLHKRSRLFVTEIDEDNAESSFKQLNAFNTESRIPRYRGLQQDRLRAYRSSHEANYTSNAGKRRLFALGDGRLMLVRELTKAGDTRHFTDAAPALDGAGHARQRGLRAARVELSTVDPATGRVGDVLLGFDVHSGLALPDHAPRFVSTSARSGSTAMYDSSYIYAVFAGAAFGSSLDAAAVTVTPVGGDASDTYAVAEPAWARDGSKVYLSLVAVYPSADDVHDAASSGAFRLTSMCTNEAGNVQFSKLALPAIPAGPNNYIAVRGVTLHRLTPSRLAARVLVHVMQNGPSGSLGATASDAVYFWSEDAGKSWTYTPNVVGDFGVGPYGGVLVESSQALLVFSWPDSWTFASTTRTRRHAKAGATEGAGLSQGILNDGLMAPTSSGVSYTVPYLPIGFGGVAYRRTDSGVKKRLWMQFEPYWVYKDGGSRVLQYPGSRPMLAVSDDGGATWQRRMLPTPWPFRAGFVVSTGPNELAVPVYSARAEHGAAPTATIYVSKDGGDNWWASGSVPLPPETWVDGNIVIGQWLDGGAGNQRFEQDVAETAIEYNRGELHPLIALADARGRKLPADPARPWRLDCRIQEPAHG
ncbi:MAG TPA: sialidase family protein [Ottowia sp.]|nr:sialidase family protein [Ottowia sp.]